MTWSLMLGFNRARKSEKEKRMQQLIPGLNTALLSKFWKILKSNRFSKIRVALIKHIRSTQGYRVSPA